MSIVVTCPSCRQSFGGTEAHQGHVIPCPSCKQPIEVPAPEAIFVALVNDPPAAAQANPPAMNKPPAVNRPPAINKPPTATNLPVAKPIPLVVAPAPSSPSGALSPQQLAHNQQQFAQQLMPVLQTLFPPGPLTAIWGQNLSPNHVHAAMRFVCPSADPNSLLLVLGDCHDELKAGFVVTPTHVHSRWRRELQSIPLADVVTATMPDKYIVQAETVGGDQIEVGVSLGDLRLPIMTFFKQVGHLNQQFPRRQPERWQGKPFPIDSILLAHWDPHQDLIFRCDQGIPQKRLAGALKTYGQGVSEQDVLGLFDDTMLAGGKSGFFFTRDKLYYSSQIGNSAGSVHYWRIRTAAADATHDGTTGKVKINLDSGKQLSLSHAIVFTLGPLFNNTFRAIAAASGQFAAKV